MTDSRDINGHGECLPLYPRLGRWRRTSANLRRLWGVLLAASLLLYAPLVLASADSHELWMEILLDGRKIGHSHTLREVKAETVRTVQHVSFELVRSGVSIHTHSTETSIESLQGEALGFEVFTDLSGSQTRLLGNIIDQQAVEVRLEDIAGARSQRSDWIPGALLHEGIEQAMRERGLQSGSAYRLDVFLPATLEVIAMDVEVIGPEPGKGDGSEPALIRVDQLLHMDGQVVRVQNYFDEDFELQRQLQPALGQTLELRRCSQQCALASNDAEAAFSNTLLDAPKALQSRQLQLPIELTIDVDASLDRRVFPRSTEQSWVLDPNNPARIVLTLDPLGRQPGPEGEIAPEHQDMYLQASRWIESDAKLIRQLARSATRGGRGTLQRMQLMEGYVRGYINNKSLDIGYASALETLHSREGDCTEHALLLAALARAEGIPARIAFGLIYQARFGARRNIYVPHAWMQAWIDGRWQSFDASQPNFGSGHLALSFGEGDPWRFQSGMALLGQLRIVDISAPASAQEAAAR